MEPTVNKETVGKHKPPLNKTVWTSVTSSASLRHNYRPILTGIDYFKAFTIFLTGSKKAQYFKNVVFLKSHRLAKICMFSKRGFW